MIAVAGRILVFGDFKERLFCHLLVEYLNSLASLLLARDLGELEAVMFAHGR